MSKYASAIGWFYAISILFTLIYFLFGYLRKLSREIKVKARAIIEVKGAGVEIKLNTVTRIPTSVMITADGLLMYQKNRKFLYINKPLVDKVLLFPFDMLYYVFAKVYLSLLMAYVYFCVKILHLPDEEIYPPYKPEGK